MNAALWIILLALAWMGINGVFSPLDFTVGLALGFAVVAFLRAQGGIFARRMFKIALFLVYVLKEIVIANIRVARDVLSPNPRISPGVIAVPLDLEHPMAITLFANLVTLTPGSLSLDISTDRKVIYVHAMYLADVEAGRQEVKDTFEVRMKELE